MIDFQYGDVITYIEGTRDLTFEAARVWAERNNVTFTEDIAGQFDNNGRIYHKYVIGTPDGTGITKREMTDEERDFAKVLYRERTIDRMTLKRIRCIANGTWSDKDEQAYLLLDAQVTGYIEENISKQV